MNEAAIEACDRALSSLSSRSTSRELVAKWSAFVEELSEPYSLTVYDYDDEVSGRVTLEVALESLSDGDQSAVRAHLAESDRMFMDRTTPCPRWDPEKLTVIERLWINRAPILRGPEIASDLAEDCP